MLVYCFSFTHKIKLNIRLFSHRFQNGIANVPLHSQKVYKKCFILEQLCYMKHSCSKMKHSYDKFTF